MHKHINYRIEIARKTYYNLQGLKLKMYNTCYNDNILVQDLHCLYYWYNLFKIMKQVLKIKD